MATLDDLRRIALALPEATEGPTHFNLPSFKVEGKNFVTVEKGEATVVLYLKESQALELIAQNPRLLEEARGRFDKLIGARVFLGKATVKALRPLVLLAWRSKAPKRLWALLEE
jgi:hypothetical protein